MGASPPAAHRGPTSPALAALMSRRPEHRIEPSLDGVTRLLSVLGDPQRAYPVVMVAGTNGKTTTSRIIERLLRASGLRTGLFTSPHLAHPRERIRIDGEDLTAERLDLLYEEVAPLAGLAEAGHTAGPLGFFETLTAMAYAAFADAPVDVAVMEVGIGGRWDAVNAADAAVAVIAPIALDHVDVLGGTIAQIAAQKAGIIAPGSAVATSRQSPAAAEVIAAEARRQGSLLWREDAEFALRDRSPGIGGQLISVRVGHTDYDECPLPLLGAHQAHNAALALAGVSLLIGGQQPLDREVVIAAFAECTSPGRLEVLARRPTVVADAAHNPAGMAATLTALTESFAPARLICVLGVMADKDLRGMLDALAAVGAHVLATDVPAQPAAEEGAATAGAAHPRCRSAGDIAEAAAVALGADRVRCEPDLGRALASALEWARAQPPGLVLVAGSIGLLGPAARLLADGKSSPTDGKGEPR